MIEREHFIGTQDELLDYINEGADIGYYVADITEICVMAIFIFYRISMMRGLDLSKYKSLWKTKKALELVKPEDRQEILRYYGPKTGKPIGKITRKALADRVFSEYCRLYYADSNGYVKCITSGVKMYWTKAQCGHFISRGVMKYRYDILNCYPQSYAENVMLSGNYKVYTLRMIDMLGKEKVEEMINDKETVEYKQGWYEENIQEWYKFIKEKKLEISLKEKKQAIEKMSDKKGQDIENMEF